jgi:hypothetical protein
MKHSVAATAESVRIGRLNERFDSWIVQMQGLKTFYYNVEASIPIVHEVTARPGKQLEHCAIRVFFGPRLCVFKGNHVRIKMVLHPRCHHKIAMKGKNGGRAHAKTVRLAPPIVILLQNLLDSENVVAGKSKMASDGRFEEAR